MAEQYMSSANNGRDCSSSIEDLLFDNAPIPMNQNVSNQNYGAGNYQNGPMVSSAPMGMHYPSSMPPNNQKSNLSQLLSQPPTNPGGNKQQHFPSNMMPSNVAANRFSGSSGQPMVLDHQMSISSAQPNGIHPSQPHCATYGPGQQQSMISQSHAMMLSRSGSNPISSGPGQFTQGQQSNLPNQFIRSQAFQQQQLPPQAPHMMNQVHNQQIPMNPGQQLRMNSPAGMMQQNNYISQNVMQASATDSQQPNQTMMMSRQFVVNNPSGNVMASGQQLPQASPASLPNCSPAPVAPNSSPAPPRMQQMANQQSPYAVQGGPSSAPQMGVASDPDKRVLIQRQLRLLLHAGRCLRLEQQNGGAASQCNIPHCVTMGEVLTHMVHCNTGKNCIRPHCASSRQILYHYRTCSNKECPVCLPIRAPRPTVQADAQNPAPQATEQAVSLQPVAPQPQQQFPNGHMNGGDPGVRTPGPISQALPQQPQFLQPPSSEAANQWGPAAIGDQPNGMMQPALNGYNWRNSVKAPHRHHLIRRIVQTIFPTPDPTAYKDPRMTNLIEYAKKVEREMFQVATSQEEYFHLLAEKCYKIHKELEEKRRHRNQQERTPPSLTSNSTISVPSVTIPSPRSNMAGAPSSGNSSTDLEVPMLPMRSSSDSAAPLMDGSMGDVADAASMHQFDRALESEYSRQQQKEEEKAAAAASATDIQQLKVEQTTPDVKSEPAETPKSEADSGKGAVWHSSVKDEAMDDSVVPSPAVKSSPDVKQAILTKPPEKDTWKKWTREELLRAFLSLHEEVWNEKEAQVFHMPVDPDALGIPDYRNIVKRPIDLKTIRSKLEEGLYKDPWDVVDDFYLMFNNAWLYNKKNSKVYKTTTKLCEFFESKIDAVMTNLGFCCGHDFVFVPQAQYCSSVRMCTINKDALYYQFDNRKKQASGLICDKYYLCEKCYGEAGEDVSLTDEPTQPAPTFYGVKKEFFMERKNNVKEREEFVICKHCGRKNHKICVLHTDEIWPEQFMCEACHKQMGTKRRDNRFCAKKLPSCILSSFLEKRVNDYLKKKDTTAGEIVVRVLSSCDKNVEVKPYMKSKFCETGEIAESFPYRLKAIFAFQNVDGVDVCFFGLHVQEYGSECAAPNTRRVYVSYLDSVFYFQPKQYRTDVYHEILVGYLSYARRLGYTMAHIWACPPSEGDDYIFHMHPPEQKIPKPKRLQEWYNKMLEKALIEKIVVDYKDILKDACENQLVSATELPYFEGDYWPNTLEEIIKEIEEEEEKKRREEEQQARVEGDCEEEVHSDTETAQKGKKPAFKMSKQKKRKAKKGGPHGGKRRKNDARDGMDEVSRRVYEIMEKHKEVFYVIRLHSRNSASSLKMIQDPDPLISSELMDGRDGFLQLSREKHLEFSSYRRTVYSTMIMLHELHTESRQNFMYTCNMCEKPIETRFHCKECDEFDLCPRCYQNSNHPHPMEKMGLGLDDDNDSTEKSEANIQESRRVSIERSIKSLVHACQCRDANCRIATCNKMKRVLQHSRSCKKRNTNACQACKQLISLCYYHAKFCQDAVCTVHFCQNIKYRVKQQQLQQRLLQAQMLRRRVQTMKERGRFSQESSQLSAPTTVPPPQPQAHVPQPSTSANYGGGMAAAASVSQGALEAANQAKAIAQMQRFPQTPSQLPSHQAGMTSHMMPSPQQAAYLPSMIPSRPQQQIPAGWRPQGPRPSQKPAPGQMVRSSTPGPSAVDMKVVQDVIANIRQNSAPADHNKQMMEWLRQNQGYVDAYRALQRHIQQASMRPASGGQVPNMAPQQQGQPTQQAWMVQQGPRPQQTPPQQYQQFQQPGSQYVMMNNFNRPGAMPQRPPHPMPPHIVQQSESRERLPSHFPSDQM